MLHRLQAAQKGAEGNTPVQLLISHSNMVQEHPISRRTIEAMGGALMKESFVSIVHATVLLSFAFAPFRLPSCTILLLLLLLCILSFHHPPPPLSSSNSQKLMRTVMTDEELALKLNELLKAQE